MHNIQQCCRALRMRQWAKNLLVAVPLLLAHRFTEGPRLWSMGCVFLSLSLCASAVYVINDLRDLAADRIHPRKCRRPFASGALPRWSGVVAAPLLLAMGFALAAWTLSWVAAQALCLYIGLAFGYAVYLKRFPILDVFLLAGLYTLRVMLGAIATNVPVSPWLLAFSMFFFTHLAFVKRFTEVQLLTRQGQREAPGRDYGAQDLALLRVIGPCCGLLSGLVFVLYLQSHEVAAQYRAPMTLWLIAPFLLYWIIRMWWLANRGEIDDDPVAFCLRDPISYAIGSVMLLIMQSAA
ncbi:MAG: UbiA family prenyltransferase [Deltaproteobacteria bacterium]|nr:UbiA family prenyltransferase [Deltaproteobacteria bacterium]